MHALISIALLVRVARHLLPRSSEARTSGAWIIVLAICASDAATPAAGTAPWATATNAPSPASHTDPWGTAAVEVEVEGSYATFTAALR